MRNTFFCWFAFLALAVPAIAVEPVKIVPAGAVVNPRQPQAAVDRDGKIYVVYGSENAIYCSVSSDGAKSFSSPVKVGQVRSLALGMRRGPRIAASGDNLVIAAIAGEEGRGKDGDEMAWSSRDGGKSWQGPVRINDQTASAREGLHALAVGPQGELFCVWLDLRSQKMELWGSSSRDGGVRWSPNRLVYRSPEGGICECCHPSATFAPDGALLVMWRNNLGGARDFYVAESRDGGSIFGPARKMGTGTWMLNACPMDGGAVAVSKDRSVATTWMREKQVFRTDGSDAEHSLGPGVQPWAAAGKEGVYVVWLARRPGELHVLAPGESTARILAHSARDPVVSSAPGGPVVAVWESEDGGAATIMAARLN